jgi:hypothetical protein
MAAHFGSRSDTIGAKAQLGQRDRPLKEGFVMATRGTSHACLVEFAQASQLRRFVALSMAALLGGVAFGSAGSAAGLLPMLSGSVASATRSSSSSRWSTTRSHRRWASALTVA